MNRTVYRAAMRIHRHRTLSFITTMLAICACSAQQIAVKSPLNTATELDAPAVLAVTTEVKAKNARATVLRSGTRWQQIGSIEQGDVMKPLDQVVIVNSFDVHEASIVVNEGMVVGYFLTVEGTFVETKPVKIMLTRGSSND